jgi:hypothetical protein
MRKAGKARQSKSPPPRDAAAQAPPEPSADPFSLPDLSQLEAMGLGGGPPRSEISLDELEQLNPDELWARMSGWTPLEFLTFAYRNPYLPMSQRIAAAARVMDVIHKAKPKGISGVLGEPGLLGGFVPIGGLGQLDTSKLSDADLAQLEKILSKAKVEPDGTNGKAKAAPGRGAGARKGNS